MHLACHIKYGGIKGAFGGLRGKVSIATVN